MTLCNEGGVQLQSLNCQRARQKEIGDEKKTKEKKHANCRSNEQGDEEEDEESSITQANPPFALCAICHLTLGTATSGPTQNVPCSKEHSLCHRCLQHFATRSGSGCVLCRSELQIPSPNLSRESVASMHLTNAHPKNTKEPLHQMVQPPHNNQRLPPRAPSNFEEAHANVWAQNYASMIPPGNALNNEDEFEMASNCGRIRGQRERVQQRHSCCNLMRREQTDSYVSEVRVNGLGTSECSRRPIRCPRIDCAINVAFSALTHHFVFDHPEVPILSVEPGTKSTLIVSFGALSSNSSRCLALLLVSDPVARLFNGSQINPKYRNRLPLPVLAARLHCTSRPPASDKARNDEKNCSEKDIIIAWVAGLDIGNPAERLRCSIQAIDSIDNSGLRSLTYTGPVNSLRTAQRPRDVFSAGDCIVLHEGLLKQITSDCTNLNINVTVH